MLIANPEDMWLDCAAWAAIITLAIVVIASFV